MTKSQGLHHPQAHFPTSPQLTGYTNDFGIPQHPFRRRIKPIPPHIFHLPSPKLSSPSMVIPLTARGMRSKLRTMLKLSAMSRYVPFGSTGALRLLPSYQFNPSQDVLRDHWRRNGQPASTESLVPSNPVPVLLPCTQPAVARPRPTPAKKRTAQPPPVEEYPEPVALPPPDLTQPALTQGDYPRVWRSFITHAEFYILRDMAYANPFPSGTEIMVREAVSTAMKSWNVLFPGEPLCFQSCKS
jgi:hypothetical protein